MKLGTKTYINLFNWDLVPDKIGLAFSGGTDSAFALDVLLAAGKEVSIVHYNHRHDVYSDLEFEFSKKSAADYNIPFITVERKDDEVKGKRSPEQFWRDLRYSFFYSLKMPIITAHHLDDCVETYLMSALHGTPKLIPFSNRNIIRPFLTVRKTDINKWIIEKNIKHLIDPSNSSDNSKDRNRIRNIILPEVLKINPGIHKVVSRMLVNKPLE